MNIFKPITGHSSYYHTLYALLDAEVLHICWWCSSSKPENNNNNNLTIHSQGWLETHFAALDSCVLWATWVQYLYLRRLPNPITYTLCIQACNCHARIKAKTFSLITAKYSSCLSIWFCKTLQDVCTPKEELHLFYGNS